MLNNNKKYIYNSTIRSIFNKIYKKYPKIFFYQVVLLLIESV